MLTFFPGYLQICVSLDVNALYTLIPHKVVGLRAVQHFLEEYPLFNPRQASFILESTEYYLTPHIQQGILPTNSQHSYEDQFCPSNANLTMRLWER